MIPLLGLISKLMEKLIQLRNHLRFFGKDPNFHYVWKSPEKLQRAVRDGLIPARDPNLKTSYGSGSEVRKIGAYGKDELILCKQPKDLHVKYEKDIEERSRRMIEATKQEGVNEIAKAGKVYIPPEDGSDDSRFTKANPDREVIRMATQGFVFKKTLDGSTPGDNLEKRRHRNQERGCSGKRCDNFRSYCCYSNSG